MRRVNKIQIGAGVVAVVGVMIISLSMVSKSDRVNAAQSGVAPVAVEVTPVSLSTVTSTVSAVGTIAAMKDVVVSSETSGRVTRVFVKVGDFVRAGQTLVQVDDELKKIAVDQAEAQLLAAETNFQKARSDYERMEKLFTTGDVANTEVEGNRLAMRSAEAQEKSASVALQYARRQYDDAKIKAPIAGYVASRSIDVGEMATPGKEIANIVDIGTLKVKLSIPEDEIGSVRMGQQATLRVDSRPGEEYRGEVYSIGSKSTSPTVHAYPVEVVLRNAGTKALKVGMFARVDIQSRSVANVLTIPKESLVSDDGNPTVFVVENRTAKLRQVRLGARAGNDVQVAGGLKEGDLVISFGQQNVKDGSPVQYTQGK